MRSIFYVCIFIVISSCASTNDVAQNTSSSTFAQAQQFQLAPPVLHAADIFFKEKNDIELSFNLEAAKIYYTLDGSDPTEKSFLYREKIILSNSATVKAKAFHPQCKPSEITSSEFVKLGKELKIKSITTNRPPHQNYLGSGVNGLVDRKKGTTSFRTPLWMGFEGGDLETIIEFEKEESISKATVSFLSDPNAWIFMPKKMMVYGSKDGENYKVLNTKELTPEPEGALTALRFVSTELVDADFKFVKILLKSFDGIPEWHPGKGTPPWLFLDEIIVE